MRDFDSAGDNEIKVMNYNNNIVLFNVVVSIIKILVVFAVGTFWHGKIYLSSFDPINGAVFVIDVSGEVDVSVLVRVFIFEGG